MNSKVFYDTFFKNGKHMQMILFKCENNFVSLNEDT